MSNSFGPFACISNHWHPPSWPKFAFLIFSDLQLPSRRSSTQKPSLFNRNHFRMVSDHWIAFTTIRFACFVFSLFWATAISLQPFALPNPRFWTRKHSLFVRNHSHTVYNPSFAFATVRFCDFILLSHSTHRHQLATTHVVPTRCFAPENPQESLGINFEHLRTLRLHFQPLGFTFRVFDPYLSTFDHPPCFSWHFCTRKRFVINSNPFRTRLDPSLKFRAVRTSVSNFDLHPSTFDQPLRFGRRFYMRTPFIIHRNRFQILPDPPLVFWPAQVRISRFYPY